VFVGFVGLSLAACPGSLDPHLKGGTGGTTAACDAPGMVFDSKPNALCATLGCHDAQLKSGGLDLTNDAGLVGRLLGVTSNGMNQSVCMGVTTPYLIDGSVPAQGLLLDKMFANPLPCGGGGSRMPSLGTLSADQIACIHSWADSVTAP
jgi:hypothetical protein